MFFIFNLFSFITNSQVIIFNEMQNYNKILLENDIPCHIQSSRVKSFQSAVEKIKRLNLQSPYDLYDLIGFRFVFYQLDDIYKFYHHCKMEKKILYTKNYINVPKDNGYSAFHFRYKNEYTNCPIDTLEMQLYLVEDYYSAIYGKSFYNKNYTLINQF